MKASEQIQLVKSTDHVSDDPDYLAWRDAKVAAALKHAQENPERRVSQAEVWKKFGLET